MDGYTNIGIMNEQPGGSPNSFKRLNTGLKKIDSNNDEWTLSDTPNKQSSVKKLKKSVTIKEPRKSTVIR